MDDEETLAVQVARDRKTQLLVVHDVPRTGMMSSHGTEESEKDIEKLRHEEIILNSDAKTALESNQEAVKRRRKDPTILENPAPGGSRTNGAGERAGQTLKNMYECFVQVVNEDWTSSFEDHIQS